jgi:DNA-binding transcriptional MerR regulator
MAEARMHLYSVSGLAHIANVSVRTLHYYDEIGLLRPSNRSEAGYRQYTRPDLMRLQQILFYRELDLPLMEIRSMLEDEAFDPLNSLKNHRTGLIARRERLSQLIETVDQTIIQIMEGKMTISDEELFAAFTPEQAERYREEAKEQWGEERVEQTEQKLKKLSKYEWEHVQEEGGLVAQELASLMDRSVEDPDVQRAVARHHAWIENFYPAPAEVYRGLGQMYAEHPEFRAFYDRFAEGLADFMQIAMDYFADEELG